MASTEEKLLDQQITNEIIADIAKFLVRWEKLAPYLGITDAEEEEIRHDCKSYMEEKMCMLRKWRENKANSATYQNLIRAAKRSGNAQLAHQIQEILGITSSESVEDISPPGPEDISPQDMPLPSRIKALEERFLGLFSDVLADLDAKNISAKEIVRHIISKAPQECLAEYNPFYSSATRKVDSESFKNVYQFMQDLRQYIRFLDCNLLKEIVRISSNPLLMEKVERYESAIESFCKNTYVASFIKYWKPDFKTPDNLTEVDVKLDANPNVYTLYDLEQKARELWERTWKLKPRVLELCALLKKIGTGSIRVTWIIPRRIIMELKILMRQDSFKKFLLENKFLKVSINQEVIYSHEAELAIQGFMQQNPQVYYVNKEVFYSCYQQIRNLLDISALLDFLKKYDMVHDSEAMHALTSPHRLADYFSSLNNLVESQGEYGYMLLYMCIHESSVSSTWHTEAVAKLNMMASQKKILPPWERTGFTSCTPTVTHKKIEEICGRPVDFKWDEDSIADSGMDDTAEFESSMEPTLYISGIHTVSELQRVFSDLTFSLLKHLSTIKAEEFRSYVAKLPLSLSKREVSTTMKPDMSQIEDFTCLTNLYHYLDANLWNFFDHHVLKYIIDEFGSEDISAMMKNYISIFKKFAEKTQLVDFCEYWPGRAQIIPGYTEISACISGDQQCYSVAKLSQFQHDICVKFLPLLSEYSMLFYKHQKETFQISWILPSALALSLQEAILTLPCQDFLKKYQICLSVHLKEGGTSTSLQLQSQFSENSQYTGREVFGHSDSHSSTSSSVSRMSEVEDIEDDVSVASAAAVLAPKFNASCSTSISIDFGELLQRGKADKGCYPSIAVNNNNVVVEVNHQMATKWMYYRVGLVAGNQIQWGDSSTPQKVFYGSGAYPRVCLNDASYAVEVHKGQYLDRCFCRVGRVDVSTKMIKWGSRKYFNVGLCPAVAINDKNTVVAVFQDNVFTKHLNYRVGLMSINLEIEWSKFKQRVKANGVVITVDVNNNDLAVLAYQTSLNHIHYKIGKICGSTIEWCDIVHKCMGFTPSISINDSNQVILVHQSFIKRHLVSNVGVARWSSDFKGIVWSEWNGAHNNHYATGLYPSISLNNGGQAVQVNEPRMSPKRNRLRYYVGELKVE